MKPKNNRKPRKTFPLQIEDDLHKALKHKAIESNKTLHTFIIETLAEKVQEDPARYGFSSNQDAQHSEEKQ